MQIIYETIDSLYYSFYRRAMLAALCLLLTGLLPVKAARQEHDMRHTLINLNANGLTIKQVIEMIEQQSGFSIGYNAGIIDAGKKVQLTVTQKSVYDVLLALLKDYRVTLTQADNVHVLVKAQHTAQQPSQSRHGAVRGRVVEFETSAPLPGATIRLEGTTRGTISDGNGYYMLTEVPEGRYTLLVSSIGFQPTRLQQVYVKADRETVIDAKLKGATLSEVQVTARKGRQKAPVAYSSIQDLISEVKTSRVVVSGISSEQISKTGDRNASEVLKRVSGLTIKDDRFVIVRGMDSRYNLTYLNDNIAPSTELYTRDFSLDLIPSRIIDRILVYKSASPDLLADMSGGAVKIYTKDAKSVRHFDIEVQTGYRPNTTFKDMLTYKGGKYDLLGFDDGSRKLPSVVPGYGNFSKAQISQRDYVRAFSPVLQYGQQQATPNLQVTANYFDYFLLGKRSVSSLTSLSYKLDFQHNDIYRQQGIGSAHNENINDRFSYDNQNIENAQLNLLQNFTLRLGDSSQLQFKNFLLNQGQKSTIVNISQTGEWTPQYEATGFLKPLYKNYILSFSQRFLYAGNLGGTHYAGPAKQHQFRWNLGYAYSNQSIPDQRVVRLRLASWKAGSVPEAIATDPALSWTARGRETGEGGDPQFDVYGIISRVWIRNKESIYNGSLDYQFAWKPWITLRAGTFQQWKERNVFRRVYAVQEGDRRGGFSDNNTPPGGYGDYVDPEILQFKEQDLGKVWSDEYLRDNTSGLKVVDKTTGGDTYAATEQQNSFYTGASLLPLRQQLELYAGVRMEYSRQKIAGAIQTTDDAITNPVLVDNNKLSILPSVNATYRLRESLVFRGAYSRTLNRPEFREIAPYTDIDYINNQYISGNPTVKMATIDNYDLRLEFYPRKQGEMISIGGFYKHLDRPIERIRQDTRVGALLPSLTFQNAGRANIQGLELELRKTLDFIPGKFFRDLSVMANATLIKSTVTKDSADLKKDSMAYVGINTTFKRPLQGQAPYIINAGLYYDNAGSGTKVSVIYNVTGTRIYAAGRSDIKSAFGDDKNLYRGSLFELPRHLLDLSVSQRIVKSLQAKLSIQNLLDKPVQMAEDFDGNYKYNPGQWTGAPRNGLPGADFEGDNKAVEYNPGRYYILSLTYSF